MSNHAVFMGAPAEFIANLQRKKDIVARLCTALHEFLCFDIDSIMEQVGRPLPKMRRPTMEDLNRAQKDVDAAEMQLEAMRRFADHMPAEMAEAYLSSQIPMLERMLEPMKDRVAMIQKALEEPETNPSSVWDGSHRLRTLCAQCAANYPGVESSIPALKVALKAAGWGRDSDGDHICPACYAAQVDSHAPQFPEPDSETGTLNTKEPIA